MRKDNKKALLNAGHEPKMVDEDISELMPGEPRNPDEEERLKRWTQAMIDKGWLRPEFNGDYIYKVLAPQLEKKQLLA